MMICEFCGAEFEDGRGLSAHMRTAHKGIYLKPSYRPIITEKNTQFNHTDIFRNKKNQP